MRFVENQIDPRLATEDVLIGKHELIARDADVEAVLGVPANALLFAFLLTAVIGENLETGQELLEFDLPIEHDTGWGYHEMWAPNAFVASEMSKERDSLDGLAQTHLVCKNAIDAVRVQASQPLEADLLVRSQLATEQKWLP